jgi:hypothetical protein
MATKEEPVLCALCGKRGWHTITRINLPDKPKLCDRCFYRLKP